VVLRRVVWNPSRDQGGAALASAHETLLRTWSLENQAIEAQEKLDLDLSLVSATVKALAWDPHHDKYLSFALGGSIQTWDLRSKAIAFSIDDAHMRTTLDIDYNPNKPYALVSGGDDGKIKFWDLRNASRPLLVQSAHSHWVWQARYNRFHDQLVLSSSSDSTLALWRISSISSAPIVELDEQDLMSETASGADVGDSKIKSYDEHEDSVYAVAWGASDSWAFASVSYDGRLAVHQVPSTEKYKILL
jgi:WD40 repeat protein